MIDRRSLLLLSTVYLFGFSGPASAELVTIGTAFYINNNYNLVYENDRGLIWLDFTKASAPFWNQRSWAAGLDSMLTYNLNPGISVNWSDANWRLPAAVDGPFKNGYEGDPDGDGIYGYTIGYNLANSEMGHLYYASLGNAGAQATDGSNPPAGDHGLLNTGPFMNLQPLFYWSGTGSLYGASSVCPHACAWDFFFGEGYQSIGDEDGFIYAMAVRSGDVVTTPIPEPEIYAMMMVGLGLIGWLGRRKKLKERAAA